MTDEVVALHHEIGRGAVLGGVAVNVTLAVVGGLLVNSGSESSVESGLLPALAIACVIATPSFLALLGLLGRPWLLTVSGLLLVPMCFLSFSFLFFPLLVPAVLFLAVAIVRPRARPRSWVQCSAAVLSAAFVVAAFLSLFAHQDPVAWHTATQSGSASDVITTEEALTSLGFVLAALAVAALAPRDGAAVPR
jgi:hypothetical protein